MKSGIARHVRKEKGNHQQVQNEVKILNKKEQWNLKLWKNQLIY